MTFVTLSYFNQFESAVFSTLNGIRELLSRVPDVHWANNTVTHFDRLILTLQPPAPEPSTPVARNFFSQIDNALSATQTLLSHLPGRTYDIPYQPLPHEELYGLLHALHQQNLQWLTHVAELESQINQQTATLVREMAEVKRTLIDFARRQEEETTNLLNRVMSVEQSVADIDRVITSSTSFSGADPVPPTTTPLPRPPTMVRLPSYQATHPSGPVRSFGYVTINDNPMRIPIDLTYRRPSTALSLFFILERKVAHTHINAVLMDDGETLLSKLEDLPYSFDELPGDALAWLHSRCTAFVYKLPKCSERD